MKLLVALLLLCIVIAFVPAMADSVYENGPVNGQVDAWVINFGYAVSDTIHVNTSINGIAFWLWLIPGEVVSDVEVSIGSQPFEGNLFDGFVTLTQSNCFMNQYGYDLCLESGSFFGPTLTSGTNWLTLQNADVPSGDPVYWDENSGVGCHSYGCPSQAQENMIGTIPSEAFTLFGGNITCAVGGTSPDCGPPVPEPGILLLFGSGVLGLLPMLRRKL